MNILLDLFLTFAKIGLFTFGGGYAMISMIENNCVERKQWIINVVYEDEPTSVYKYTLKDGNIVESGVSGTTDKEDLKH